jgi:hypothetical protein
MTKQHPRKNYIKRIRVRYSKEPMTFELHDSDVGEIKVDNPGVINIVIGGPGRIWQTASPLQAQTSPRCQSDTDPTLCRQFDG